MFLTQTAKEIVGQPKGLRGSSGRGNRVIGGEDFDWTFDPIFGSTPGAQSVSSSSAYAGGTQMGVFGVPPRYFMGPGSSFFPALRAPFQGGSYPALRHRISRASPHLALIHDRDLFSEGLATRLTRHGSLRPSSQDT